MWAKSIITLLSAFLWLCTGNAAWLVLVAVATYMIVYPDRQRP